MELQTTEVLQQKSRICLKHTSTSTSALQTIALYEPQIASIIRWTWCWKTFTTWRTTRR